MTYEYLLNSWIRAIYPKSSSNGKYASTEEVIIAGIKLLEERERIYQGRFEELKREIAIGVEAAEHGETVDGEVVFSQLKHKLQQRRQQVH